jgi:predicted DNA-binding transcriptional regulator YafY
MARRNINNSLPLDQHPQEAMDNIIQGATNLRTVSIRYRDSSGDLSERVIEPYEIKNGKLFGYCQSRAGIRAFKTENILAAVATNTAFEPKYPIKITPPVKS